MKLAFTLGTALATMWLVSVAAGMAPETSRELGVTGRINANPAVAASGRFAVVAWGATPADGPTDIYLATSRDAGATFTAAVRVNDDQSPASLSGEQPPAIALVPRRGSDPEIVVVWTSKGGDGARLLSARSRDGGKTFTHAAVVPGTDAVGNRGWESVTAEPDGRVVALWLDHRGQAMGGAGHAHMSHQPGAHAEAPADGVARAQLSKVFFGPVGAAGARSIAAGVCYCCKTALAAGADGTIYAAWRHVYAGNLRDIAFAASRDGGRTFSDPLRVSEDHWELDGCPENGPAIALDTASHVHIVWPTLVTQSGHETLALFHAVSRDDRTFSSRERIPTSGAAFHPQMAFSRGSGLLIAWDETGSGGHRVHFARAAIGTDAPAFAAVTPPGDSRGAYPAIAATDAGALAAWATPAEAGSQIQVVQIR